MEINEIMQDFRRRWEGGFVWVEAPDSGEESLFHVDRITHDRTKVGTMELSSPEYGKILLNMGTAHTLKFKYPPVGVFQNGVDAFMFRRVPAKQYKHAIYYGNSSVCPVYNPMVGRPSRNDRGDPLKFDDVLAAFRGERYTFEDALKMLSSGRYRSVALQRNWSLCLNPMGKEGYVLLYWETPVAMVSPQGIVLHIYEKQFEAVLQQVKES
jgi:hypothetical protein